MSDSWTTEKLGDVADVAAGNSAPQDDELFKNGTHLFIRTSDAGQIRFGEIAASADRLNDAGIKGLRRFPRGTILVPKSGASTFLNHRVMMSVDGYVSSHLAAIKAKPSKALDKFLLYYLSIVQAQGLIQDHAYPSLRLSDLESIDVPIPSIPEQKRIVAILDEAFAGIAAATANAEKNLANARELFDSYLDAVFSRENGWSKSTVEELVGQGVISKPLDGNHGEIHPKKADFVSAGVPFIMASDLVNGVVDQENCNFLSRIQADSLRTGYAKNEDVLLSHKGTIGRVAVLETKLDYVMLTPQVTFYRVLNSNKLLNRFMYYFFQSKQFKEELSSYADEGSTRAYIGITKQLKLHLRFPSLERQIEYVAVFDSLIKKIEALELVYRKKIASLGELRQALLQKAFSGELMAHPEAALQEEAA